MKNILAILLMAEIMISLANPVWAIEEGQTAKVKNSGKIESVDDKSTYINLDWWNKFNDPYLSEYILKAITYNHNLKIASITTKEYYEAVKIQFANQLPTLGAGVAPAYVKMNDTTESGFQFALPLLANYEIDLFLKNRDKTKSVRKSYEMAVFDERSLYISVISALGSTYFNIVKLDKDIEIQKQIVAERKTIFDLMSKRNKIGITSTADMIRANKSYVGAVTELTELEKQRDSLLNSFCTLIGESSSYADSITRKSFDEISFDGLIPENINSEIISERPDYQRALLNLEKAGIDLTIAKKEFLPSINISGLALFNAADLGKIFNTTRMISAIGGMAGFDIFKGGAKLAGLRLKKHSYERAIEEYKQTNLTAIQEVNDALLFIKKDNERLQNTLQQENFEEQDYNFYLKRYEKGIVSKLDLAQSKENLLVLNKLTTDYRADCFVDYIGLYKAVGSQL